MSGALLTAMFLVPGLTSASTPSTYATASGDPPVADPGAVAGFTGWITNTGTSNIAQLDLVAVPDVNTPLVSPVWTSQGGPCTGAATPSDPALCDLGQLRPGSTAAVTLVYQPGADVAVMNVTFTWTFSGKTGADGGQSHGDSVIKTATVNFSGGQDASGRYITTDDTTTIVQNTQSVSDTNKQALKVVAPGKEISAYVVDGPDSTGTCTPTTTFSCPSSFFGEWMTVGVANGTTFSAPFPVTITYDSSGLPQGVSARTFSLYHNWLSDLGRALNQEIVSASCTFTGRSTTPSNAPCLQIKKLPGGDLQITLWTYHNGVMRGLG